MPERARQLVLDLPVETRFGEEDFLVGASNEVAHGVLRQWAERGPEGLVLLEGPRGSGKSHLAAIWAGWVGALAVPAGRLGANPVADAPLVLEDIDRGPLDEAALFHCINRWRERRLPILLTSAAPLDALRLGVPDLVSRLRLAPLATLGPPDDPLLRAVLVKLFADRQVGVEAGVVDYLALRIERSLAAAAEVVAALDREAMSRGRRITRAVAADVVGPWSDRGEDPAS